MTDTLILFIAAILGLTFAGAAEWVVSRSEGRKSSWFVRIIMLLLCLGIIATGASLLTGTVR